MDGRKVLFIAAGAFVALIIGLIIFALIPRATLILSVAPEEITLVVNGSRQSIKTGQEITVTPGTISIELQRDEFDIYTETFEIKNGETREVLYALNPQTDAARELLKTVKSQRILERIAGVEVKKGAEKITQANPILKDLPINDKFYVISACSSKKFPDDTSKIAVCINLYDMAALKSAQKAIVNKGYVLTDYEIIVNDVSYTTQNNAAGE